MKEDKEAREQIRVGVLGATDTNMTIDEAVEYIVRELKLLGYRKIEGKPPLITCNSRLCFGGCHETQRDSDKKWMRGE